MQDNKEINQIRKEVEENIGKRCLIKADKGRKRIVTNEGVIQGAFDDVFTVRITNDFGVERTVSFTYTDILTSTVKVTIY